MSKLNLPLSHRFRSNFPRPLKPTIQSHTPFNPRPSPFHSSPKSQLTALPSCKLHVSPWPTLPASSGRRRSPSRGLRPTVPSSPRAASLQPPPQGSNPPRRTLPTSASTLFPAVPRRPSRPPKHATAGLENGGERRRRRRRAARAAAALTLRR